ncbi:AAA family ATPase [Streptomyces sp. NPDC047028]|uniref:ATP-binding protein n=1 Tax=Streptomyces sp. NPDC047028 TaxID=3155793 RepID=UPI0033D277AF
MRDQDAFVGREPEVAHLQTCAREARDGHPWVVTIEGEAGVGKTTLVRNWLCGLDADRFTIMRAQSDLSEQDIPFGVVQQLISSISADILEDFPLLKEPTPATAPPYQVGQQLLEMVSVLQAAGPLVVVIEDLHWVDAASLQAWGFVLRRIEVDCLLTVLTMRPPGTEPTSYSEDRLQRIIKSGPNHSRLALRGLDATQVAELVEQVSGRRVQRAVADRLHQHTGGNPLYVRTVVAEMSETELTGYAGAALPVPPSFAAAVRSQLHALPEPSRLLVQAAAILETSAPLLLVGRIAQVETSDIGPALESGLLRWRPNAPSQPVEIPHALKRHAVIEATSPEELWKLHTAAARLLDRRSAWSHRVAAAETTDSALAAELAAAAEEEYAAGAAHRAATLLLWASDLEESPAGRERYVIDAAARLEMSLQHHLATSLMPRVRACAPSARRSLALGLDALLRGPLAEADAHLAEAVALSVVEQDMWARLGARTAHSPVHYLLGRPEEGAEAAREVVAHAPDVAIARAHLSVSLALSHGPKAGLREIEGVVPPVLLTAEPGRPVHGFFYTFRGLFDLQAGALRAAIEDSRTALAFARSGESVFPDTAYVVMALAHYLLGDWDSALIHVERGLDVTMSDEGQVFVYPVEYAVATWLAAGRGEWAKAQESLRAGEKWALFVGGEQGPTFCAISRAVLAQARGDHHEMLASVRSLTQSSKGWPRYTESFWLPLYAEASIHAASPDEAEDALTRLRAASQEDASLRTAVYWLTGLFAEKRGDLTLARSTYEQGLDSGPPPDEIPLHRAMLDHAYGRCLIAQNSMVDPGPWLDRARARLEGLQAAPFLERCARDLPAASSSQQPDKEIIQVTLTQRERDIALLVARGLTNREIAGELFVSSKTVEYHLGHVYAKLGLANRRQLRDHVHRTQTPVVPPAPGGSPPT